MLHIRIQILGGCFAFKHGEGGKIYGAKTKVVLLHFNVAAIDNPSEPFGGGFR
jgi:hypothetical protein